MIRSLLNHIIQGSNYNVYQLIGLIYFVEFCQYGVNTMSSQDYTLWQTTIQVIFLAVVALALHVIAWAATWLTMMLRDALPDQHK